MYIIFIFHYLGYFEMEILKHLPLPYLSSYSLRIGTSALNNMYVIEGFYTYWQVALQGSWSNLYHHDEYKRVSVSPTGSIETDQSV